MGADIARLVLESDKELWQTENYLYNQMLEDCRQRTLQSCISQNLDDSSSSELNTVLKTTVESINANNANSIMQRQMAYCRAKLEHSKSFLSLKADKLRIKSSEVAQKIAFKEYLTRSKYILSELSKDETILDVINKELKILMATKNCSKTYLFLYLLRQEFHKLTKDLELESPYLHKSLRQTLICANLSYLLSTINRNISMNIGDSVVITKVLRNMNQN